MNGAADTKRHGACGCCKPNLPETAIHNPPGLPELAYRIGTHSELLRRLIVRLPKWTIPDGDYAPQRPLAKLTTRSADDPAIALLDAWAVVGDVIAFYQERIANEAFLRTATERRSVLELARAIGYELDPGVAASVYLVFTVDDAEQLPGMASIPAGTQVQSVPASNEELPQTFETADSFVANSRWNELRPLSGQRVSTGSTSVLYLDGVDLNLDPGDMLLIVQTDAAGNPPSTSAVRILLATPDLQLAHTRVELADPVTLNVNNEIASASEPGNGEAQPLSLNESNVRDQILSQQLTEEQLQLILTTHGWTERELIGLVDEILQASKNPPTVQVYVLREAVGFFGNNAPKWLSLPASQRNAETIQVVNARGLFEPETRPAAYEENWDDPPRTVWTNSQGDSIVDADAILEREVSELLSDTWAVFEGRTASETLTTEETVRARSRDGADSLTGGDTGRNSIRSNASSHRAIECKVYRITEVELRSVADYAISAKATALAFSLPNGDGLPDVDNRTPFLFRSTTAYVKSEKLELTNVPITDDLQAGDTSVVLDRIVLGLNADQPLVLTGRQADGEGVTRTEIKIISLVTHQDGGTTIQWTGALEHNYIRETVTIRANVVLATHGETVSDEVLGSGNGSRPFQTFQLKKPPLTYVSAPSGSKSTLNLRVEGVRWQQLPSLFAVGPASRSYTVRIDDDAKPSVIFGDGEDGARLPTGPENIRTTYRSGIGVAGNVGAGSLMLLKTKPFGIRSVTNPRDASGGEDPERLANARENAPVTVLTLDRVVSLRDYEDYTRSFPGIGKARADTVWTGEAEIVHVTIATADGKSVDEPLFGNLFDAIAARRDPLQEVRLGSFTPLLFDVGAAVLIDVAYEWETVRDKIDSALRAAFSFAEREFALPVSAAEAITVIHSVPGVVAVDLNELVLADGESGTETSLATVLQSERARFKDGEILPAQLLLINTSGIQLTEMQP